MLDAYKTTGSSPPCRITLTDVLIMPGCTIALGEGMDQCGRVVCFAGDWRLMLACAEALDAGRTVEVYLHGWQIIAWRHS